MRASMMGEQVDPKKDPGQVVHTSCRATSYGKLLMEDNQDPTTGDHRSTTARLAGGWSAPSNASVLQSRRTLEVTGALMLGHYLTERTWTWFDIPEYPHRPAHHLNRPTTISINGSVTHREVPFRAGQKKATSGKAGLCMLVFVSMVTVP